MLALGARLRAKTLAVYRKEDEVLVRAIVVKGPNGHALWCSHRFEKPRFSRGDLKTLRVFYGAHLNVIPGQSGIKTHNKLYDQMLEQHAALLMLR